jgi:SAM-dependent methyltransferase
MTFTEAHQRAFADYETKAWVRMTPHYETFAGRMTRQTVTATLDAAGVGPRTDLLDVASGPGYIAAAAGQRGARPVGIDFSSDMVAIARRACPGIDFQRGDAEALPFEAASFDAITCAFGMLHFPRPGRALAEARRVLRSGGRFAFTAWATPPKGSLFALLIEGVQKGFITPVEAPTGPGPYMLGDPMVATAVMDAARFADIRIEPLPCVFALDAPDDLFQFMMKCSPRAAYLYERQPAEGRALIEQSLRQEGARAMAEGGKLPCPALLISGAKAEG